MMMLVPVLAKLAVSTESRLSVVRASLIGPIAAVKMPAHSQRAAVAEHL